MGVRRHSSRPRQIHHGRRGGGPRRPLNFAWCWRCVAAVCNVGGVFEEHPRDLDFFSPSTSPSRAGGCKAGLAHRHASLSLRPPLQMSSGFWFLRAASIRYIRSPKPVEIGSNVQVGNRPRRAPSYSINQRNTIHNNH